MQLPIYLKFIFVKYSQEIVRNEIVQTYRIGRLNRKVE